MSDPARILLVVDDADAIEIALRAFRKAGQDHRVEVAWDEGTPC